MATDSPVSDLPESPAPAALEIDQSHYGEYLLYSRSEILFITRSIMQKKCMLTAYFDGGRRFFMTTLMAVSDDGNWLYFDVSHDPAINDKALRAGRLMFTTMLDKVKIQFSVAGVQEVPAGSSRAFACRLPETLLRLQRREHYRLTPPLATPLKCEIPAPLPGGGYAPLALTLVDISGGGIGIMVPDQHKGLFAVGGTFTDCKIGVPDEGPIVSGLCVRSVVPVANKAGGRYTRVGCEFVGLASGFLHAVQRYIIKTERERKAREAGLE